MFLSLQTDTDQENLVLNHMTNVAVKTHQMTDRKLSSLVTGGPPLWITRHRHSNTFRPPSPSRRPQQNVIFHKLQLFTAIILLYLFQIF